MVTALYKLTDENDRTYSGCQWGEDVQHVTSGEGQLCGDGWTHWYTDPLLAVLLNPIHADFALATAHLWEGQGTIGADDNGLKVGCTDGRTLRRVEMPRVTLEQRIRFGILCARVVYGGPGWNLWADEWLSGKDRTTTTAKAAMAEAAEVAARAAEASARAAAAAAEVAARAVVEARAKAAAWAAEAAEAAAKASRLDLIAIAREAEAALRATEAALMATGAAAAEWAAEAAEASRLDLIVIAREAVVG